MKWGMIARMDNRGLGVISREVHRYLRPDRTLVIHMGDHARGFTQHPEWYEEHGQTVVTYFEPGRPGGPLDADMMAMWAKDLDVVWSAETFYDWRFPDIIRSAGGRSVLHTMPEFHRRPECDLVDRVWLPTPWRREHHPAATLVPIPVALGRLMAAGGAADPHDSGPLRVLHKAGHVAAMDRNGTRLLSQVVRACTERIHLTVLTQDPACPAPVAAGRVTVDVITGHGGDYWDGYAGHHVMLLPRRYGGLCLPAQEALGAGLAVIMPDVEPNGWWPTVRVPATRGPNLMAPAGEITTVNADPIAIAAQLDAMARDRSIVAGWQAEARRWATWMDWGGEGDMAGLWMDHLAAAAL